MKFEMRGVSKCVDVKVRYGRTKIDLGFMNKEEAESLAETLTEARDYLLYIIEGMPK